MGWEPVIYYTYDDDGRLISSQAEVEWDDTEREGMLGLQRYRDTEVCGRCGGPKWICQASDAEHRWEATLPSRCHITTAIRRAQDEYGRSNPAAFPEGLLWGARLKGSP